MVMWSDHCPLRLEGGLEKVLVRHPTLGEVFAYLAWGQEGT